MCEIWYDVGMIFINCVRAEQTQSADIIKCGNKLMCVGHNIMWNLKQSLEHRERKKTMVRRNQEKKGAHTHTRKKSRGFSPHKMHHSIVWKLLKLAIFHRRKGLKSQYICCWKHIVLSLVFSLADESLFNAFVSSCENRHGCTLNLFNF